MTEFPQEKGEDLFDFTGFETQREIILWEKSGVMVGEKI